MRVLITFRKPGQPRIKNANPKPGTGEPGKAGFRKNLHPEKAWRQSIGSIKNTRRAANCGGMLMAPICPHCEKEVSIETMKISKPKTTFVLRNIEMAYCPHCRKVLGVFSHVI